MRSCNAQVSTGVRKVPLCGKEQCGPCKLCNKKSSLKYFHLSTMQSKDLQIKIKQACNDVDINDCICSACRLKYLKKLKSSTYTPEKTRKIDRNPCFLTNFFKCSDLSERDNQCQIESFNSAFSLQCVLFQLHVLFLYA